MDAKPDLNRAIMLILKNALRDWRLDKNREESSRFFCSSVALLECRNNSDSKLSNT